MIFSIRSDWLIDWLIDCSTLVTGGKYVRQVWKTRGKNYMTCKWLLTHYTICETLKLIKKPLNSQSVNVYNIKAFCTIFQPGYI